MSFPKSVLTLVLAAIASFQLVGSPAHAAETSPDPAAFPKGLWTLELSGSYSDPIRFSEDEMAAGTVGLNYYLFDNLSLGLHASGYAVDHPRIDDGYAVGLEGFVRWHVLTLDRATLYIDGGGGRAYFDPETPEGGTHWNWTAKVGAGVSYRIDDNVYLIGGARYFHVSNGNQFGRENNPSYDAIQYYVGLLISL